jgi:hypothetical protein
MDHSGSENYVVLNLRPGELVEVRNEAEILATLDAAGTLDALPFMPEMLEFCGKKFIVYKRSDKTCDTIDNTGGRRMWHTVHLENLRCDGGGHGGCQARCLFFWKEAWLKRVRPSLLQRISAKLRGTVKPARQSTAKSLTHEELLRTTIVSDERLNPGEEIYSCQATELLKASVPLAWWDIRQYFQDVWTGNASLVELANILCIHLFTNILKVGIGHWTLVSTYNKIQEKCGGTPYPFRRGTLTKTPVEELHLQTGELVQVKTQDEILKTLDKRNKNRGLFFDVEMAPYCNGKFRVLQRVERIISEKTGRMTKLPGDCIMLEGVVCKAVYSEKRIACPRSIYSYWREIWLKRAE